MENYKTVKIIKDITGNELDALVIIGRVAIIRNGTGDYVQIFCDRTQYTEGGDNTNGWRFGSGIVTEYQTLQDAVNGIHPKSII